MSRASGRKRLGPPADAQSISVGVGNSRQVVEGKLGLRCRPVHASGWCTTAGASVGDPQTVFVVGGRRVRRVRVVTIAP